jgi:hypothetical protein
MEAEIQTTRQDQKGTSPRIDVQNPQTSPQQANDCSKMTAIKGWA